jgi:segregation and condensation protein B
MYATTKQFLDYFNLKSLDQLPALAEIRDLETLNAELGFSEPVREGDDDPKEVVPELTVVGGTEHVQEDSASAGEQLPDEPAEAMAELRGELRAELRAEAPEHDVTALPSESSQANAGLAEDAPLDTQALEEQGISLDEAVEDLESRAVEPVEQDLESLATASAEDAAPEADRFEEPAPKPESQA